VTHFILIVQIFFLVRLPAHWEQNSDHKYLHSYLCARLLASQWSGQGCLYAESPSAGVNAGVLQTSGPRVGDYTCDDKSPQR